MPTIQEQLERKLGFRIGNRGVEQLIFEDVWAVGEDRIIMTKHIVNAVRPVLDHTAAARLWQAALDATKEAELKKREREVWSQKAFEENERNRQLQGDLENANRLLQLAIKRAEDAEKDAMQVRSGWKSAEI